MPVIIADRIEKYFKHIAIPSNIYPITKNTAAIFLRVFNTFCIGLSNFIKLSIHSMNNIVYGHITTLNYPYLLAP